MIFLWTLALWSNDLVLSCLGVHVLPAPLVYIIMEKNLDKNRVGMEGDERRRSDCSEAGRADDAELPELSLEHERLMPQTGIIHISWEFR